METMNNLFHLPGPNQARKKVPIKVFLNGLAMPLDLIDSRPLHGGRPDSTQAVKIPYPSGRWTKGKTSNHVAMHIKSDIDKMWLYQTTKTYSNGCKIPFRGNPHSIPAPSRDWASLRRWQITMSGAVGLSGWGGGLLRFLK